MITGSAGVLGRSLAVEFSKYGAFLCLWDIDERENQKTYELLYTKYNHRRMVAMKVDITLANHYDEFDSSKTVDDIHRTLLSFFIGIPKKFIEQRIEFDKTSAMFRLLFKMRVTQTARIFSDEQNGSK